MFNDISEGVIPFKVLTVKLPKYSTLSLEISREVPNSETLEAIREVEEMKKNPSFGKSYTDIDKMMEEMLS